MVSGVEAVEDLRASSAVSGRPVSELKATTRISAPSSARTLVLTRSAITSSGSSSASSMSVVLGALAQDRQAGGEVRRLDVGDEPGLEALAQTVLERLQVVGRAVGGEHDLPAAVVEGVEGVEELLLGLGLALEELDVVEEQHVDVAEAGLEAVGVPAAERAEELVGEGLAGRAADGRGRGCGRAAGSRSS